MGPNSIKKMLHLANVVQFVQTKYISDCLGFYVALENFLLMLIWAVTVLWRSTPTETRGIHYNSHLRGAVTTYFYDLVLSRLRFNTQPFK